MRDRLIHAADPSGGLHGVDLTLGFGLEPVVHEASVSVRPGRVTALVGPNGSGKSTVLRALARLHRTTAGDVRFDDDRSALPLSAREFARHVTLLTQSRPIPTGISVRDVVAFGRHPHRRGWRGDDHEAAAAMEWAMEVTGVAEFADRGIEALSGGECQRVWVATCLCQRTSVLLLDEPTTYLDLRHQVELLDLVRDLADHQQVAIGIVLHDLQQAADLADEVVLLDRGRVVAVGTPESVLTTAHLTPTFGIHIESELDPLTGRLRLGAVGRHSQRERAPIPG